MTTLIAGAAGNLGTLLTTHLLERSHRLRLLVHKAPLPPGIEQDPRIERVVADLNDPETLAGACAGIDSIVYVAGVLFRPRPESFLHTTNVVYVQNLVNAAKNAGVRMFILMSFPHVEGESTPDAPAMGLLEAHPNGVHARTRLAAEQFLFRACADGTMKPLVLRAGVIYGPGVKLTEAARGLMRKGMFAVWRKPTWVHLLSLADLRQAVEIAVTNDSLSGIYNLCDDQPLLLTDFVGRLASHWGYRSPPRLPDFVFRGAAVLCEEFAALFHTAAPINRDIMEMGMTSVVADTSRMKREILPVLTYPTLKEGLAAL